jgi:putative FmdB family regulatory protein
MPNYEYVCTACGTRIEVSHGVNESGPAVCTACGGALRKAVSAPAIVFRGSGWAKKDARSSSSAAGGKTDSTDSKPSTEGSQPADSAGGEKESRVADA